MLEPPQLRTFHSPQIFTALNKMPATSLKLMSLLHSLVSSHACRVLRSLSRAKSLLLDFLRDGHLVRCRGGRYPRSYTYHGGSFRLHYNWCSSRSFSVSLDGLRPNYLQYDAATWNVAEGQEEEKEDGGGGSVGLSGYLRWLEERKKPGNDNGEKEWMGGGGGGGGGSEIDEMADVFIAMCREKFVLEKQESDRRFQDMLARSI